MGMVDLAEVPGRFDLSEDDSKGCVCAEGRERLRLIARKLFE